MKKAEQTRQFIIEKAALILNQKGMAGTAISDIMEATSLAKGGIYGNFENKDEICLEAFNYLSRSLSNAIEKSLEGQVSAKGKLTALFGFYEDRLLKTNTGGCPILNFGTEADDTSPVIKQRVKDAISNSQNRIARLVREGITAGEFVETFDAETFAIKAFAMIEGAILIGRVQNSKAQMTLINSILRAELEQNSK